MRQKTILLGLLFLGLVSILLSSRAFPVGTDTGLNPGEMLPSIMVDGKDLTTEFKEQPEAILVVWSVDDATSRVVNSWVSNDPHRGADIPIYSICIDAEQQDAEFFAQLDNVNPKLLTLWGIKNSNSISGKQARKLLAKGNSMVFHTTYGKIQKAEPASVLWERIQNEMAI